MTANKTRQKHTPQLTPDIPVARHLFSSAENSNSVCSWAVKTLKSKGKNCSANMESAYKGKLSPGRKVIVGEHVWRGKRGAGPLRDWHT